MRDGVDRANASAPVVVFRPSQSKLVAFASRAALRQLVAQWTALRWSPARGVEGVREGVPGDPIPGAFRALAIKTHWPHILLQHPEASIALPHAVVYIVRNPLDVAFSIAVKGEAAGSRPDPVQREPRL